MEDKERRTEIGYVFDCIFFSIKLFQKKMHALIAYKESVILFVAFTFLFLSPYFYAFDKRN